MNHCWKDEAIDLVRRPLAETGQNGRNEENGNSQLVESKGHRLQAQIEMIHRVLIQSGDLSKLRELSARTLYTGSWKHDVLSLCKEAVRTQPEIYYEPIYSAVKNIAMSKISKEARQEIIAEVKNCFLKAYRIDNSQMMSIKKDEI
ncbi:enhancer of yellow 2 transcription factor [Parasteatoda tepidariorum]|uniref:enhancer of yellow 2 transcription factor n=1 Tax=Parasteatoda tepidariorum TaxID=114398 RepID=UPI00077FA0FD|nr:enhancer of yellow 2 transcription factor isoform X1 [Parasteatoda tepidariorum]XP_042900660.1 enhancer of yellow 2 transcription factor isoform X1 [Parasteatoda tepidariorum]XP_042900661.1 enhancer of yellow 2 transcription factor isoform X2 [Parasteatoda tepidariorum]